MSVVETLRLGGGKTLDVSDAIARAAERIGCEAAILQAIINVESGGAAFDGESRLIILPEKHIFNRLLPKGLKAQALRAGLAALKWSRANYKGLGRSGSDARWDLLERMARVDEEAALQSVSYGAPQIMGFNYRICGYSSVTEFVLDFAQNNVAQVEAFIAFLERSGLSQALREKDFAAIARRYNGPGQIKRYAAMMLREYLKLGGIGGGEQTRTTLQFGSEGYRVKALQERLNDLGYTLRMDGDFGPATRRAVIGFQADHGLTADGIVGPKTEDMLEKAVPLNEQPGSNRMDLTLKDLRKNGSKTVKNADWLSRIGHIVFGTGAAAIGLENADTGLIGHIGGISTAIQAVRDQVAPLLHVIAEHQWLAAVALGLAVIVIARRIKLRRLDDARNWRHLG